MTFFNLSPFAFVTGIAAIAGVLFALQRLRVRHRRKIVITTLFWKEALEEARARVLVKRFKHPLTYLLLLLLASLMWFGFADPRTEQEGSGRHVILVDASAGMARGTRFDEVVKAVRRRASELPAKKRTVILCGADPVTILAPEESLLLLDERLDGLRPDACPSTIESTLRELSTNSDGLVVELAGDAAVRDDAWKDRRDIDVRRLDTGPADTSDNTGITALGVTAAASGAWNRVDVLVEIDGASDTPLEFAVGDSVLDVSAERRREGSRDRVVVRDLLADGGTLTVRLADGGGLAMDDAATITLPNRPLIRVGLGAGLEALKPVLDADPAVLVVGAADPADVLVTTRDDAEAPARPTLAFVSESNQVETILLRHRPGLVSREVLIDSFNRLGLDQVDTMDIAERAGHAVTMGASPASERSISLHASMLSTRYNFVQSRSFPLFIATSIRWLAGITDFPVFVAAGEAVAQWRGVAVDDDGIRHDAGAGWFTPPRAGRYRGDDGTTLAASLLDPASTETSDEAGGGMTMIEVGAAGTTFDFTFWLGAIVLVLCTTEWFLHRTGRIP